MAAQLVSGSASETRQRLLCAEVIFTVTTEKSQCDALAAKREMIHGPPAQQHNKLIDITT